MENRASFHFAPYTLPLLKALESWGCGQWFKASTCYGFKSHFPLFFIPLKSITACTVCALRPVHPPWEIWRRTFDSSNFLNFFLWLKISKVLFQSWYSYMWSKWSKVPTLKCQLERKKKTKTNGAPYLLGWGVSLTTLISWGGKLHIGNKCSDTCSTRELFVSEN